jgi:hypothetical protein
MDLLRNFRLVASGIDPEPLLRELSRHPKAWSFDTEWTEKKDRNKVAIYKENIVLRYATIGIDAGTGGLILWEAQRDRDHWNRPWFEVFRETAMPLVRAVRDAVDAEHIGHIIISRLPPGGTIGTHIDVVPDHPALPYWQRYQVPLWGNPGIVFRCGEEEADLVPGNAYWFNARLPHSVHNRSNQNRISMILDIRQMF